MKGLVIALGAKPKGDGAAPPAEGEDSEYLHGVADALLQKHEAMHGTEGADTLVAAKAFCQAVALATKYNGEAKG